MSCYYLSGYCHYNLQSGIMSSKSTEYAVPVNATIDLAYKLTLYIVLYYVIYFIVELVISLYSVCNISSNISLIISSSNSTLILHFYNKIGCNI